MSDECQIEPIFIRSQPLRPLSSSKTVTAGTVLSGVTADQFPDWTLGRTAWFSDGVVRAEAVATYTATTEDIGHVVYESAVLTFGSGCNAKTVTAASPGVVVKAVTQLATSVRTPRNKPTRVAVNVTQDGSAPARGLVIVTWKGEGSGTATRMLPTAAGGRATVRLPKLTPGSYRLAASFVDTEGISLPSTGPTVKFTVRG